MQGHNKEKLANAANSSNIFHYIFRQRNQTPVLDFLNENEWLKKLGGDLPTTNKLGYEVVSPDWMKFITTFKHIVTYAGQGHAILPFWPNHNQRLSDIYSSNSKDLKSDYNRFLHRYLFSDALRLFPLEKVTSIKPQTGLSEDHDLLLKQCLRDVMISYLSPNYNPENGQSFSKLFKDFEKVFCGQNPTYAPGAPGTYKKFYCCLDKENIIYRFIDYIYNDNDKNEDIDEIINVFYKSCYDQIEEYFADISDLTSYVSSESIEKGDLKKVDHFISRAFQIYKEELIKEIPLKKKEVSDLRHNVINELKEEGIIVFIKSWIQACFGLFKAEEGSTLSSEEQRLKQMQDDLKVIKSSSGYIYGFYYTPKLKEVLSRRFDSNKGEKTDLRNIEIAINAREATSSPSEKLWAVICGIGSDNSVNVEVGSKPSPSDILGVVDGDAAVVKVEPTQASTPSKPIRQLG